MYKFKFYCIVILLIFPLLFAGCTGETGDNHESNVSYCDTLNQYVRQGSQLISYGEGVLKYEDLTIGKSVVLCSKPNCKHQEYDYYSNANPECEAAVPQGSASYQAVAFDGNTVYQLVDTNNNNETAIYKAGIDNPGRKKLCTLPYSVAKEAGVYFSENFIYMVGKYDTVDEINHTSGTSGTSLTILRINADSGKYETLSPAYYNDTICQIIGFYLDGGNLYYELRELKDGVSLENIEEEYDWDELLEIKFYRLQTDGKHTPEVLIGDYNNISFLLGVENGKLFYVDKKMENIRTMDLDSLSDTIYLSPGVIERCQKYDKGQFIYLVDDNIYYQNNKETPVKICSKDQELDYPIFIYDGNVCIHNFNDGADALSMLPLEDYLHRKDADVNEQQSAVADAPENDDAWTVEAYGSDEILESVELTEELYEKNWPGKKQLIWMNDLTGSFDTNIIVELNNQLIERGYDFVIRYMERDTYSAEFMDELSDMRAEGTQLDLFNMGGISEGETGNRYKECVDSGLAAPLNDYLESESGQELWNAFDEKVWSALEMNGKIYSYDWRLLPYDCLNAYVKKEYAQKYGITSETTVSQLFEILKEASKEQEYCILNTNTNPISYWGDAFSESIKNCGMELVEVGRMNRDSITKAFLFLGAEDYIEASDDKFCSLDEDFDVVKLRLTDPESEAVTNNLLGIASWTENYEDVCEFIKLVNTDSGIANLLQYGIEGRDYALDDSGRVKLLSDEKSGFGNWTISNRRISLPQGLEPLDKEDYYKQKIADWSDVQ